jgi:hypothetical protein
MGVQVEIGVASIRSAPFLLRLGPFFAHNNAGCPPEPRPSNVADGDLY